jgi:hypothetical protein
MRLPSLDFVLGAATAAARRFPLVLAAALTSAAAAVFLIGAGDGEIGLIRLLLAGLLGIPLLLTLTLTAERWPPGGRRLLLPALGLAALVAYGLTLPARFEGAPLIRFALFAIAAHLAVCFLPLWRLPGENAFWQFNKALFLRLLAGLVFSLALMLGLSVALLALDKLFGLTVDGDVYPRLYVLTLFLFNTWYFLAGVPARPVELEGLRDYPPILRIFAQYILAPLVAVYLALLTAYLVKVLVTAQWPSGWIGWLVSSVGAAGLASLALLHPLTLEGRQKWIAVYARLYFVLLLPAVTMLLLSVGKRIGQYGITEARYLLTVLALWLGAVALLGALGRLKSLRPLPLSLCLIALAASAGPWGAFSVSRHSQLVRLEALLEAGGMLAEGRFAPAAAPVDAEARRELSAVLYYLVDRHGPRALAPYLDPALEAELAAELNPRNPNRQDSAALSRLVMRRLGLEYVEGWQREGGDYRFYHRRRGGEALALGDYAWVVPVQLAAGARDAESGSFRALDSAWTLAESGPRLVLSREGAALLAFDLAGLQASLRQQAKTEGLPPAALALSAEGGGWRALLLVNQIAWQEGKAGLTQFDAELFLAPPGAAVPAPITTEQ